jgi:hypothetical protein
MRRTLGYIGWKQNSDALLRQRRRASVPPDCHEGPLLYFDFQRRLLASEEVLVSTLKIKFASTSSAGWLGSLASRYLIQCAVEILIQRLTDGACIVTAADFTRGLVRID